MWPGVNRIKSPITVNETAMNHANHRQRREGRWPSGKSSSRNVAGSTTTGIHEGPFTAAAMAPPVGSDPVLIEYPA